MPKLILERPTDDPLTKDEMEKFRKEGWEPIQVKPIGDGTLRYTFRKI